MLFNIISRYVSRTFLVSFFVGLLCIFVLILLFDFAELQRKSAFMDMGLNIKLNMILLRAPHFIEQIIPFLSFVAGLYTFWRMNRSNELVIFRTTGISLWRIILPISLTAFFIGLVDLTGFNPLSTAMLQRYEKLDKRYFSKFKDDVKIEATGLWLSEKLGNNQTIYRASKVNLNTLEFNDFTAVITSQDYKFIERLDAESAQIQGKTLVLKKGWDTISGQIAVPFDEKRIPTELNRAVIERMKATKGVYSFWKLPDYISLLESSGFHTLKYKMQWHSMIACAFWVGVMILLAAAFSCRPMRQGKTLITIMIGLVVGFLLYFFKDMTFALGSSGSLPPIIAAWLPPLVTIMVGAVLVFNQEDG